MSRGLLSLGLVLWLSVSVHAAEATQGYTSIQRAFLREEFQTVATLAQAFLADHPEVAETPRVWIWLALSLDRLQRSNEALTELARLKSRLQPHDPLRAEVLFWEGDISRRAFQMLRAKLAFRQLLERHSDSSWAALAQLGMGLIDLHQQAFDSAAERFHNVATTHAAGTPVVLEARLYEGLCHLRLQRFPEAVAILQPLVNELRDPLAGAQAAFYLGESLTGLARYDEAVGVYQRAIASTKDPSQWGRLALFGLGWAHYRANRCEESIEAFRRYLAQGHAEHHTEALFARASCLSRLGREGEALSLFQQILASDPGHPLGFESGLVIADASRRQGKMVLAKGVLHGLLRRSRDERQRARVQIPLGAVAVDQGKLAQARTIFQLAAAGGEPSIRQAALNGLGDVELHLGNLTEAKRFYEEVAQPSDRSPATTYATYQLGRIALQQGSPQEAVVIFQQLIERASPELLDEARLALALAYLHQREDELARVQLARLRQPPERPIAARAAYYQALLALSEGREAEAERLCDEAIAGAPRTEEATDARLLQADLLARRTSVREARGWLHQMYRSTTLAPRDRAKLAKRLGDFAREESVYTEALRWYDRAAQWWPSLQPEATYRMASCYEEGGDLEMAIRWYQMIDEPPWRIRGQLAVAKLFERQDRLDAAKTIYERLAREPVPEAKIGRERLAVLRGETNDKE